MLKCVLHVENRDGEEERKFPQTWKTMKNGRRKGCLKGALAKTVESRQLFTKGAKRLQAIFSVGGIESFSISSSRLKRIMRKRWGKSWKSES